MVFGKTVLRYSRLPDDSVIDYVVLCTKIQKMMITFHIAHTACTDHSAFHRKGYVAGSLHTCNWGCGVRVWRGNCYLSPTKKFWLDSLLWLLPHELFYIFIHRSSIQSHWGWRKSAPSVDLTAHFSFTTLIQCRWRATDVIVRSVTSAIILDKLSCCFSVQNLF